LGIFVFDLRTQERENVAKMTSEK